MSDYPFRVEAEALDGAHSLVAHNDGPASITVRISLDGSNLASDRAWPVIATIPRYSRTPVAKLYAADPAGHYDFSFKYTHHFGDINAVPHAADAYRLPFADGKKFPVSQAFGGHITSHVGAENEYAVDLAMPEGTPIVAARDGIVIEATYTYTEGGKDPLLLNKANEVVIQHPDGLISAYVHLSAGAPVVQRGQQVKQGQPIGFSGNTGYSTGPHLHFAVMKPVISADGVVRQSSIPVNFYAFDPPVRFQAHQGDTFVADYTGAPRATGPAAALPAQSAAGLTAAVVHHQAAAATPASASQTSTLPLAVGADKSPPSVRAAAPAQPFWSGAAGLLGLVLLYLGWGRYRRKRDEYGDAEGPPSLGPAFSSSRTEA